MKFFRWHRLEQIRTSWVCLCQTFLISPYQWPICSSLANKKIKYYNEVKNAFQLLYSPGQQSAWISMKMIRTHLKTEKNVETLVIINWMSRARNFSATGIRSWTDTLYLHWNATSFFRVENEIRIFILWCNLGFRREREITLNTLLMNHFLKCFIIIIAYMALIFRSHRRKPHC